MKLLDYEVLRQYVSNKNADNLFSTIPTTTFALSQRHERREMNGNNKMTSFLAGMSCFPSERVVKVVVNYKNKDYVSNHLFGTTTQTTCRLANNASGKGK